MISFKFHSTNEEIASCSQLWQVVKIAFAKQSLLIIFRSSAQGKFEGCFTVAYTALHNQYIFINNIYLPRQELSAVREPVCNRFQLNSSRAQVILWTTTSYCHVRRSCCARSRSTISWNHHRWHPSVRLLGTHGGTRATRPIFRVTLNTAHRSF